MNMEKYYRTKDLSVAALLYASGKKLLNSESINERIWFLFENRESCEKLVESYWRKEVSINAKEFSDAMRTLKDLIFNK